MVGASRIGLAIVLFNFDAKRLRSKFLTQGPVPRKSCGNFSGDIVLFVSLKRRCSVSRNFAVLLIFTPFTTYEKTSFTE